MILNKNADRQRGGPYIFTQLNEYHRSLLSVTVTKGAHVNSICRAIGPPVQERVLDA